MKIEEAFLKVANEKSRFKTNDVLDLLKNTYSRQAVSAMIGKMVKDGSLLRSGKGPNTYYALPRNAEFLAQVVKMQFKISGLAEDEVLERVKMQAFFWNSLESNVRNILIYAFSEMVNNAIDHSRSNKLAVEMAKSDTHIFFKVRDLGVGVFRNIMQKRKLKSELEAVQDLLKGKTTTAPDAHSGEGIFFTSKIADEFWLRSFDKELKTDNIIDDVFFGQCKPMVKGTSVGFRIALNSKRVLRDLFEKFDSGLGDYEFDVTQIKVKIYQSSSFYVSRSEAKRLLAGLTKFRKIILDFEKVTSVGQAFCDEIFRVFARSNPKILLEPINMIEPVEFMVRRAMK